MASLTWPPDGRPCDSFRAGARSAASASARRHVVDVSGARRSTSCRLTSLIAETEGMCVCVPTSAGRASAIRLTPAQPGYRGNEKSPVRLKEITLNRKLNQALWIVAGILAVVFVVASSSKLLVPKEKQAGMFGAASKWVEDFSPRALRAIGVLEFLAAVGLIVPAALGIAPVLVPLAATGAVVLFTGAVVTRLRRGERATIIGDLAYLAMAAFVAWGRFGPGSFTRLTQQRAHNPTGSATTAGTKRPGTAIDSFRDRPPNRRSRR
jgi:hypothetical protein